MGRGGRWAGWDVGWGMVINIYSARLCLCGEGRRGGGEREEGGFIIVQQIPLDPT